MLLYDPYGPAALLFKIIDKSHVKRTARVDVRGRVGKPRGVYKDEWTR